jgi:hypothetical protein
METELADLTGVAMQVNLLVSGALSPFEALVLMDTVRPALRGVVILDIAPLKFRNRPESMQWITRNPRLAIQSDAADSAVVDAGFSLPKRTGNYFIDNYRFFVARPMALVNLVRPIPVVKQHSAEHWGELNEVQWQQAAARMTTWEENYTDNRDWVFDIYARTIRLAQDAGLRVALLESTRNPKINAMLPDPEGSREALEQYHADVIDFAARQGVPYWDLAEDAALTESDFADQNHLRDREARRRFTRVLAERVAGLLTENET